MKSVLSHLTCLIPYRTKYDLILHVVVNKAVLSKGIMHISHRCAARGLNELSDMKN
jgi:hypothetical protein